MTTLRLIAALASLVWMGAAEVSAQANLTPPVPVDGGLVAGTRDGSLASYQGIPFAAPPVLDLRWRAPRPVAPWSGVRVADRFSAMCPQPLRAKHSVFYLGEEPWSEDCLYLNVWSTAAAGDRRPVMVFVYGGGWTIGSGSLPLYGGEGLARTGAVVVTFNYRVGALGFLAHPELTAEGGGASGNYGLMDILAALRWVQGNIARFGGDPTSVTVYGQSAGAAAISLLQASPPARGLFHRAIGQSGAYAMSGPLPSRADAEKAGVASLEKLKAASIKAARNLGADAIMAGDNAQRPIVDGSLLAEQPADVYRAGRQMAVPLLVGANADEGTAYPFAVRTAAAFEAEARQRYGARADTLLTLYPSANDADARAASYALLRDRTFAAPLRRWALEQAPVAPVFMYHFSRRQPFVEGLDYQQQSPARLLGAYHGAEMAYAFGALDVLNRARVTRAWTEDDRKYSEAMMGYWVNFARTGNPNGAGLVEWPAYTPDRERVMLLGDQMRAGELPQRPQLDFLTER